MTTSRPFLLTALERRSLAGNRRRLRIGESLIDFASNDYLGLARSPVIRNAVFSMSHVQEDESPLNGLGSTGSRLLTGNSAYAEALERTIADYHGWDAGLLFHSGYLANIGLLSSVMGREDVIFYDAQIHASTRDGMRMSCATAYPFKHNDPEHLERRLQAVTGKARRFVCVESVYSIDGSMAPLQAISSLCRRYEALLIVDEAHAVGIFGPQGRGLVAENALADEVFALVVTFGKALGAFGAAVLGSHTLKEYLINFSRPCIYSTALPLHALAAIRCAYALLPSLNAERSRLSARIEQFRRARATASPTAVQSIEMIGNANVKRMAQFLAERGYAANAIMSPTVRQGHECLRLSLHAYNTPKELDGLLELISQIK